MIVQTFLRKYLSFYKEIRDAWKSACFMWSEPLMSKIAHRPLKGRHRGQAIIFLRNSYGNTIVNDMNRHGDAQIKAYRNEEPRVYGIQDQHTKMEMMVVISL